MIIVFIAAVICIILGGLGGYLIGTKGFKNFSTVVEELKDKVEGIHTKTDSIKDDLVVIEGVANTIKGLLPDSEKSELQTGIDAIQAVTNIIDKTEAASSAVSDVVAAVNSKTDVENTVSSATPVLQDAVEQAKVDIAKVSSSGIVDKLETDLKDVEKHIGIVSK